MIGRSRNDRIFDAVNTILLFLLLIIVFYPLYFVVIASVSSPMAVNSGDVLFYPVGWTLTGYTFVFKDSMLWHGYLVTIVLTLLGTMINLALTFTGAYALTKTHLPLMRPLMFLITFTMFLAAHDTYIYTGIQPETAQYAVGDDTAQRSVGLQPDTGAYDMMKSISEEVLDAARIDGCSDWRLFVRIVMPLSTPIVATMALFYGVGHWNQFFAALIYISDQTRYLRVLVLRNLLLAGQNAMTDMISGGASGMDPQYIADLMQRAEILKYAVIIVATAPILAVYPFLQKYFVNALSQSSLKG